MLAGGRGASRLSVSQGVCGMEPSMARDIVIWPHKVLTTPTKPVTDFGPALDTLLAEMEVSMREAEGIGIAANQVGVPLRCAWVGREDGTFFAEAARQPFAVRSFGHGGGPRRVYQCNNWQLVA